MAIFSIMEFASMPVIPGTLNNAVPVGLFDNKTVVQAPITLTTASQQSSTFGANTRFIRVYTSGICNFVIGTPGSITASTASAGRMPADHTEYFGVCPGQAIAVITDT